MLKKSFLSIVVFLLSSLLISNVSFSNEKTISIGTKSFTESYILGEMLAQIVDSTEGYKAERRFGLNDIAILARALEKKEIDIYPDYTGTISYAFLKKPHLKTIPEINQALKKRSLEISNSLGFNNTYVMVIQKKLAQKHDISKISDLKKVPNAVMRVNPGFLKRPDGLPGLTRHYGLNFTNIKAMEHGLLYQAIGTGKVDLIEAYSTNGNLAKLDAVMLDDDRSFFPSYFGVLMYRSGFMKTHPEIAKKLKKLEGILNEQTMRDLNALVDLEGKTFSEVAQTFLIQNQIVSKQESKLTSSQSTWSLIYEHIELVFISMLIATLIGVPMGIIASRKKRLGQTLLMIAGLFQTIPSLALLCFFIPVFGIGKLPAIIALFVYSILPILRNTYTGFATIDSKLIEVEKVLGMSQWQKIFWIELPLASQSVLAGIKTSLIINIGTATLAALIGAGGLGVPIITGLSLNNIPMILQGAVPAAALAMMTHFIFEGLDRILIPKGLQKRSALAQ